MKKIFLSLFALMAAASSFAAVKSESMKYKHGNAICEGVIAYDDATQDKRPGIIVVHEWWGRNEFAKKKAEELAAQGYVALAIDMYGLGKVAADATEAGKLATFFKEDRPLMRGRANAGLKALKSFPLTDGSRLAAIGFCFGGTVALEMARGGVDLDGVVSLHGGLSTPTPNDAKNIQGRVLVLHGADDPYVPMTEVTGFMDEMKKGKVDYELTMYSGAVHAFTNPDAGTDNSKGAAYNEKAATRAWNDMSRFLSDVLKK